jgi:hypothetical protein
MERSLQRADAKSREATEGRRRTPEHAIPDVVRLGDKFKHNKEEA